MNCAAANGIRWFRRADPDDELEEEHAEVVLPEQIDFGEPVEPVQEIRQLPEVPEYAVIVATAATVAGTWLPWSAKAIEPGFLCCAPSRCDGRS